jgi:hypothetical protein
MKRFHVEFRLTDEQFAELERKAKAFGFFRAGDEIRRLVHQRVNCPQEANNPAAIGEPPEDCDLRIVRIPVENYRELAYYVDQKKLSSVPVFAAFAMQQYMSRNRLTEAQTARFEKSIED